MAAELDQLCINTVRFLSVDAVQKANSGHPGMPLGAAPMAYVLWTRLLKHNPRNPDWFDRDRFVLSAGHGRGRRTQRGSLRCIRTRQRDTAAIRSHRGQRLCPRTELVG